MQHFGEEVLVPLAALFCLFGLPISAFIFFRLMAHRERMEMIRNGLAPAASPRGWRANRGSANDAPPTQPSEFTSEGAQTTLRKGITLTFIGFALTLGLSFIGYHDGDAGASWHPGPWLLGGFIPMFVGLAQVSIALLSGATLRVMEQPAAPPGAQRTADSPHVVPPFDGPYTYRPGSTQELRPPHSPPERRP